MALKLQGMDVYRGSFFREALESCPGRVTGLYDTLAAICNSKYSLTRLRAHTARLSEPNSAKPDTEPYKGSPHGLDG